MQDEYESDDILSSSCAASQASFLLLRVLGQIRGHSLPHIRESKAIIAESQRLLEWWREMEMRT